MKRNSFDLVEVIFVLSGDCLWFWGFGVGGFAGWFGGFWGFKKLVLGAVFRVVELKLFGEI
jgi:hypothetical protein